MIIEKLRDPAYVRAVESFFNVTGVAKRRGAFCEPESHKANELFPLVIKNETRENLVALNQLDNELYAKMSGCGDTYDFPEWDEDRFSANNYWLLGRSQP